MRGALLLGTLVAGFWWWRADPDVERGNAKVSAGAFQEALADYARAEATLDAEEQRDVLAFNRGVALHGAGKLEEARKAFAAAAQSTETTLRSRAAYNEGVTAHALQDKPGAVDAYVRALRDDPAHLPARHNLELLLTQPDPPPSDGGDGQGDGGGGDGGPDGGPPDGGGGDGGGDGGGGDGGSRSDGGAPDPPVPPPAVPQPLTQQEARQLLDAMRDAEKNRPLGRIMLRDDRPRRSTKEW
jgi:tetratricopeptide (TPR) repeat protein